MTRDEKLEFLEQMEFTLTLSGPDAGLEYTIDLIKKDLGVS